MSGTSLCFVITLACLMVAHIQARLSPAGKCDNRQYNTSGIGIRKLISQSLWKMTWITDGIEFADVDHGSVQYFTDPETHIFSAYNEFVLSNSSSITNTCAFKDVGQPYFIEECINDDGSTVVFRDYSLYFVTAKGGLYLRCVEGDGVTVATNTVIIGVTGYPPLADAQVQTMLQLNLQTCKSSEYHYVI